MTSADEEEELLRSVALQNARSILVARKRAEDELQLAQDELRRSEELLRVTFERAGVGIAIASLDGRFVQTNQKFVEILGYDQEQLRQLNFRDITHPDDAFATEAQVRRLLAGEISDYKIEKRYLRNDGQTIWSFTNVTLIRGADGEALRFVGVIEDITSRRRTEDALRGSEQFSRTIIESSGDCIKTLSLEGNLLWMSESGCRTLQIDNPAALVGRSWIEFWDGEDRSAARAAVLLASQGGTGKFVGTYAVAGRPIYWDVVVTPIHGLSGTPATLLAVSRDVTRRMEMERTLREEARVLDLLNTTGSALASQLDLKELLQNVTDAATELSGASFGAFFYNTKDDKGEAFQLFALSGAARDAFEPLGHPRATPLFGPTFLGEGVVRCDDVTEDPRFGQMGPYHGLPLGHLPVRSFLAVPVITRSGEVIGGLFFGHPDASVFNARTERVIVSVAAQAAVAIDNARLYEAQKSSAEERRQLLQSERLARAEAERLSATKDEFLAVLSHELRTPLNAILGWAGVLRMRVSGNAEWSKSLEIIERNARMQNKLIDDLLDMSRIIAGKMALDLQPVSPFSFIEAAVETVRPAAAAKGIGLDVVLDRNTGPVSGDAARLQQVVWNLLSNAIKFTPSNGRVHVLLDRLDSHVEIVVADTGLGISPQLLGHVFERFRQGDSSSTRHHAGLGLGLAIVKHLVELHGGTVSAESEGSGRGTTFTVQLPLIQRTDQDRRSGAPANAVDTSATNLDGLRVLVVDDEQDASELTAVVLRERGAVVFCAASALEALVTLERERPDVLVSDIGMPGTDGFELLRRVRALGGARGGNLPAVALTAFARAEDRQRALHAGFVVHLSKPIEPANLIATVAKIAGRGD